MKIIEEQDLTCSDIEVTIKYERKDELVRRIIRFLESADMQIRCETDGIQRQVNVSDIYYIESVDKKSFLYLEKQVYHTELRLYQLADQLKRYGFVQISKSCILNINVLESIKPIFNSRMEAILKNGEKVYINRSYLNEVKQALKGEEEI